MAFSPDGGRVLSGSGDGTIKLWAAATGALIRTFGGHSGHADSVAFSRDGGRVLSGSYDKTIKLWDAATGALIRTLEGHSYPAWCTSRCHCPTRNESEQHAVRSGRSEGMGAQIGGDEGGCACGGGNVGARAIRIRLLPDAAKAVESRVGIDCALRIGSELRLLDVAHAIS